MAQRSSALATVGLRSTSKLMRPRRLLGERRERRGDDRHGRHDEGVIGRREGGDPGTGRRGAGDLDLVGGVERPAALDT